MNLHQIKEIFLRKKYYSIYELGIFTFFIMESRQNMLQALHGQIFFRAVKRIKSANLTFLLARVIGDRVYKEIENGVTIFSKYLMSRSFKTDHKQMLLRLTTYKKVTRIK